MRTDLTNYDNGEPLYSQQDVNDLTSFTAIVLAHAVKHNTNEIELDEYIKSWCEIGGYPTDVYLHISARVCHYLNSIRNNG